MSEQKLPLIFALKHLHVRYRTDHLSAPSDFSRSARLMQGDREIPQADDKQLETFLNEACNGSLPDEIEMMMLQMSCAGWPEDSLLAFAGVSALGPGNIEKAKACVQRALKLNRDCTLARQLVKLLLAKAEIRIPFGSTVTDAPDVPAILAAEERK